jgi:DNA-binding LytR/AlgR family response regulator
METIELADLKRRRRVAVKSIEYFEGVGNYTFVHLKGERPVMVSKTLLRFAEQLPDFIRIHKKMLVNPEHIVDHRIQRGKPKLVRLSGDRSLTISRRRVSEIDQYFTALSYIQ